jgi:hypothetical protein
VAIRIDLLIESLSCVIGLAALLDCVIGYVMAKGIGTPLNQLLMNVQLARNGNIELMEDLSTRSREIDEIGQNPQRVCRGASEGSLAG